MGEKPRRFWRTCRICFRRFRITVWTLILLLLCCVLYLNQVGLPNFVKQPLLEKLRARGVDLEFERIRWRWHRGIVAENVRFTPAKPGPGPRFSVSEAQLQLDFRALLRLELQVRGLVLRQGQLVWELPVEDSGRSLTLENIHTDLRLLPGDLWALENFRAQFAGANLHLGGIVTNASALRHLARTTRRPDSPGLLHERMDKLARVLEQIHFTTTPELHLDVSGDALNLQSFALRLNVNTPDATTPWGTVRNAFLTAVLAPAASNEFSHAEITLEAAAAHTRWAEAGQLRLNLQLVSLLSNTNLAHAKLELSAASIHTQWTSITNAQCQAEWEHSFTNALPHSGKGSILAAHGTTRFGDARDVRLEGSFRRASGAPSASLGGSWLTNIALFNMEGSAALRDLHSPRLSLHEVTCSGRWNGTNLTLANISSRLYDGQLSARAAVDVESRLFTFSGESDFNPHEIGPLLTEKSRRWIGQFGWEKPPRLSASGHMLLPAWTNLNGANWRGEVRPTVRLDGHFAVGNGSFRGITFESATSHFSYSNLFWRLPDLAAHRAEGDLHLTHISNEATRDYHFGIRSRIDPAALKPLFDTGQHRVFEILTFHQPPDIQGEIQGRWYDHDSIGARMRIAATNFQVRSESFDAATGEIEYTNLIVRVKEPRAWRGVEHASATSLDIDIPARKIYVTNAVGVADPQVISRAIGPKIGKHMEPYRFREPVHARVNGIIPMRHERDADLHFEVEGRSFEWWKFRLPRLAGRVHWRGEQLELRGLQADFYRGTATGEARFDFSVDGQARYQFDLLANDAELALLMRDLSGKTNRLEGRLVGRLTIVDGVSTNLGTVQGTGRVVLRDGLIWEIPIFGVLSPVLDGIAPGLGLGSSRAREGSMSFVITNGVARTEDLEIRASMMRLQYAGTVALDSHRIDARVQAELFRDTWVVGRVLSLTLWPVSKIFEYRFTGTLQQPRSEPVYFIPKVLLLPFQPLRTLKDLAPDTSESRTPTNTFQTTP